MIVSGKPICRDGAQVGFSGDVNPLAWNSFAYQPYFSATASNVGYGFWSHDIEGPGDDHELYTRWIQWASYSAVFRSHDRGMSGGACADHGSGTPRKPFDFTPHGGQFDFARPHARTHHGAYA